MARGREYISIRATLERLVENPVDVFFKLSLYRFPADSIFNLQFALD